ncbi:NADH dehydrogenase [Nitrospira japonica]|uniref:NADH:ubiquinone reductase (non-electrogenic) n=1 Tax=Nitrospira japonica TaxID=1325564 RepID=A0A1W1I0H8_9BACT|nr:NAD(P)/FAD-dependent oxidoreductase [Nitrospira japonica]SLM46505.1 NADH dehydrogenase [Nitrospira japonica]
MPPKQVVIIGGGFGGLSAARRLRHEQVVLIDRTNHHLFQPLLYQVAMAALSPSDIAWPLRTVFRSQPNVRVVMDEVLSVERAGRVLHVRHSAPIPFEVLILAPGARHAYFGHDEWEESAPGLKTMTDAVLLRQNMLLAFEEAERRAEAGSRERLTFVIIGGGPTGVELAGALAEIGRKAMGPDFPALRLEDLSIVLVEGGPRLLPGFSPDLSAKAATALTRMGVTVRLDSPVRKVDRGSVTIGTEVLPATNILWAAGNRASPLLGTVGVPLDQSGRIKVEPDLTIPGDPWIFAIGDAAHCPGKDGAPLPGLAPVAMQQGRYVAAIIAGGVPPEQRRPFVYRDRGMLATIGRARAVAQIGPVHTSGVFAWLLWCLVHIFFLVGFRNRVRVMSEWIWFYLTFKPGARVLFERPHGFEQDPIVQGKRPS